MRRSGAAEFAAGERAASARVLRADEGGGLARDRPPT